MKGFDGVDIILFAETEDVFENLHKSEPFILPLDYDTDAERYVLCWKVDDDNYLQQGLSGMFTAEAQTTVIPLTVS